jgi:hypothetical protein
MPVLICVALHARAVAQIPQIGPCLQSIDKPQFALVTAFQ